MTTAIYILKLKNGKYYVGQTHDVDKRYREHRNGTGSAWTRAYAPLGIDQVIHYASPFDEDKYVKKYMSVYGIDNVRGGSYSQVVLDDAQKSAIQKELRTAEGSCMKCGRMGHFAETCYAKSELVYYSSSSDDDDSDDESSDGACFRCGREGHWVSDCYARRHVNGSML